MFDIGFWELVLISVVGLVVLGPERLPHAIRSVSRFVGAAKTMANNVKDEISHELKVQELQDNLRKAEQMGMEDLSPELKSSVEKLKQAARDVQRPYTKEKQAVVNNGETQVETIETPDVNSSSANDTAAHESSSLADKKTDSF